MQFVDPGGSAEVISIFMRVYEFCIFLWMMILKIIKAYFVSPA